MKKSFKLLAVGLVCISFATTTICLNSHSQSLPAVHAMSKRAKIDKAVSIMQENYEGQADVYYDSENDAIAIKPTTQDFEEAVIAVIDGDASKSDWHKLTDSIDDLSKTVYEDVHIKTPIAIVNPENTDKVLYASYDGTTLYDVMDDNN
ncbi:hypothetical protein [Limosilactobacillus antri]|uniref:hypothetical protein n=1 Tax=Limosilactobacillus antri TaxID=227943 RepID=UPI001F5A5382|nr:hypothetical protein [Limosilactobacillus antri]